jgi:hypothetical protein
MLNLSVETLASVRAELARRRVPEQELPDYLCSVWVRNRMREDKDKKKPAVTRV